MKTQNMETRSDNTLENLDEQTREGILEIAMNARLADVVISLAQRGVKTSKASLSRFIRRDQSRLFPFDCLVAFTVPASRVWEIAS
jgi:hypothetical protein